MLYVAKSKIIWLSTDIACKIMYTYTVYISEFLCRDNSIKTLWQWWCVKTWFSPLTHNKRCTPPFLPYNLVSQWFFHLWPHPLCLRPYLVCDNSVINRITGSVRIHNTGVNQCCHIMVVSTKQTSSIQIYCTFSSTKHGRTFSKKMLFVNPNVKISKYWSVKFDFTFNMRVNTCISSVVTCSVW